MANLPDHKDETKLRIERHQLETIFQQSPAAMVLWRGPDFIFEKINPRYQAIFPDRALLGRPFLEACPEFKGAPFQDLLTKVLETGEPFVGREILARHSDCEGGPLVDHYYDFTSMRVNDTEGKPYGVYDHAIDVTDRVRARETIQNQKLWLEEVLNRLPLGLVIADPISAKYQFTNNAAHLMLGQFPTGSRPDLSPDKLTVRDSHGKLLTVDEIPSARASRGEELVNEVIILERGQDQRFVSCNSNIIPAMPGHTETVLIPFIDITALKKTENELKDAVRARDEFLSLASHELKTPITSLKLQSQMFKRAVEKGDPDAYSKDRVDKLADQTIRVINRLQRLIDEMLDISRIRTGRLTLQSEKIELVELAKEVLQRMECQFLDAKISRPKFSYKKSPWGLWDRFRIEQVLTNLLTNAIRYGNGTQIEVGIDGSEQMARFWVKDNGIGIAPEDQRKIFERFERLTNASEASGLGLGLYITHQIVKAHGGHVFLKSGLGQGSTFIVDLPLQNVI